MWGNTLKRLLCVVLTLLMLTSCSEKENKLLDFNGTAMQPTDFTFETEHREYSVDTKTITYVITNTSEQEISISTYDFILQCQTEDGWKSLGYKDGAYIPYLATVLGPNEIDRSTIALDEYFHLPLEAGEYRIVKDGFVSNVFQVG